MTPPDETTRESVLLGQFVDLETVWTARLPAASSAYGAGAHGAEWTLHEDVAVCADGAGDASASDVRVVRCALSIRW